MDVPEHINFTAKHKGWIVAKKLEIDSSIEDIDIARHLISVRDTFNYKIYHYLDKDFNISFIEKIASEIVPKGALSEEKIAEILKKLKGGAVTRKLSEVAKTPEEKAIAKAILVEKVLERLNLKTLNAKMMDKYIEKR